MKKKNVKDLLEKRERGGERERKREREERREKGERD